jgi:dipeptidyl aminopeptidase/acylaminoacyl peptidase
VALKNVKQPILILQGALDTEISVAHADRLEQLSLTVRNRPARDTRKVIVPGVNHLFVPATSGDVEEYTMLEGRSMSPAVSGALVSWLPTVLSGD